ncbi:hypothetical protein HI914_06489 [Erysiphe necator]|nr:hypothetical protein HI914_06489 [Erysiphe necator]
MIMKPDKENKLVVKEKVKDTSIEKQEKSSILDKKTENIIINNDAKEDIQKLARKRNNEDIPKAVFENRTNESPEQPFKALRGDETSFEEITCTKNLEPKANKDLGPGSEDISSGKGNLKDKGVLMTTFLEWREIQK